jgi:hypothetical protein
MIYSYYCDICKIHLRVDFPMGKAKKKVRCNECSGMCERHYEVNVNVPQPTSEARKGRGKG